jgi:hypothetical protein
MHRKSGNITAAITCKNCGQSLTGNGARVIEVERRGEESEWKGADAEAHVESAVTESKAGKVCRIKMFRFRPLTRWSGWQFVPWILTR